MLKDRSGLDQLDLNLLYTFRTFVEHGSVERTARALGRSQPAISARLHQLQRELGVQLLQKSGRRLELTPTGRVLDTELRSLVGGLVRVVDGVRAAQKEPSGVLRLGALPTVGVFVLAPAIVEYRRTHGAVSVDLRYGLASELVEALRQGDLDAVASVGEPPSGALLDVTVLGYANPVLVLRRGTRRLRAKVRPDELSDLDWVAFGKVGDPFFDAVWDFLERRGLESRVRIRIPHIQTLEALALAGAGATILPDYTVRASGLERRRIEGLDFKHPIWLATRRTLNDLPLVRELRSLLRRRTHT